MSGFWTTGRLEGHCLCGAVTIVVDGPHEAAVGACHCRMCQRWNGSLYMAFEAPAESVAATGNVSRYASSPFTERAFCTACGSHLWLRQIQGGDAYELFPGLFPEVSAMPLRSEIYVDKAPAYVPLSGVHRRTSEAEYQAANPHLEGDA